MDSHHTIDTLYRQGLPQVKPFEFNEQVASVFPDMIRRSVPGYEGVLSMTGLLARAYAQENSHVYDLGCSLGAVSLAVRANLRVSCRIIAVDNSPAMVSRCQEILARDHHTVAVDVLCADIRALTVENASFVVLNYVLQFIPLEARVAVLKRIYAGMLPGSALILSEKVIAEDHAEQYIVERLYQDFKRQQGYNDLEIAQKRQALENILVPETCDTHLRRLQAIGFEQVFIWERCLGFVSFLAHKPG